MANVRGLIDFLSQFPPDTEVRLMTQQNWPFEHRIKGATSATRIGFEPGEKPYFDPEADDVVYIVEGYQIGYGDADAWDAAETVDLPF